MVAIKIMTKVPERCGDCIFSEIIYERQYPDGMYSMLHECRVTRSIDHCDRSRISRMRDCPLQEVSGDATS